MITESISFGSTNDDRWLNFVKSQKNLSIFHHPEWVHLLTQTYHYKSHTLSLQDESGNIVAGLPFIDVDSWLTGRRYIALPFTDYFSPLSIDQQTNISLIDQIKQLVVQRELPPVEIRWHFPYQDILCQSHDVLHLMKLNSNLDEVERSFHTMHRRNIKDAIKNGVSIEKGNDKRQLAQFYQLHLETRKRQGVPVQPWRFFDHLQALFEKDLGFVMLAYHQKRCVAGAVFLHWGNTLTYKYGASLREAQNIKPNNLIFAEAIKWGCVNGYSVFDLGKTDAENVGLRGFKSRWGADEVPLFYSHITGKNEMPQEKNSGMKKKLLNFTIRHSPVIVGRVIGEVLYGHFA